MFHNYVLTANTTDWEKFFNVKNALTLDLKQSTKSSIRFTATAQLVAKCISQLRTAINRNRKELDLPTISPYDAIRQMFHPDDTMLGFNRDLLGTSRDAFLLFAKCAKANGYKGDYDAVKFETFCNDVVKYIIEHDRIQTLNVISLDEVFKASPLAEIIQETESKTATKAKAKAN